MAVREKDGRIPVYLRIRPCSGTDERCLQVVDGPAVEICAPNVDGVVHRAEFSHIFRENASQIDVFQQSVLPLVEGVVQRHQDALLIAYGASGSGKTHTVSGTRLRGGRAKHAKEKDSDSDEGVLPQAIRHIFNCSEACGQLSNIRPMKFSDVAFAPTAKGSPPEAASDKGVPYEKRCKQDKCSVWLSVVQVYNEVVTDLLVDGRTKSLALSQDVNGRCFVRDVSWHETKSARVALDRLAEARSRQNVTATKLNDLSSRSHFIAFVKVIRKIDNDLKVNQLVIADLAGNERAKASGGTGSVIRQAGFINCSLLVLSRCVDAVRRGLRNIPYRDSKLTRILSPFLAGRGPFLSLIVCVNPHKDRVDDTLSTVKFSALASELTQPAEVVQRFQETRRKSAHAAAFLPAVVANYGSESDQESVLTVPLDVFQAMQSDLALGERLARENEELRRNLQLREEALENSRLMHEDRLAALRTEYRSKVRQIRDEHREARQEIESELQRYCAELSEKCAKYKKQAALIVDVFNKRVYPELEEYRSQYGLLKEFPLMQEDELRTYGRTSDSTKDFIECSRCCLLLRQLEDTSRRLKIKVGQSERMVEELRSERELRVLLQERTRAYKTMNSQAWSSAMEYTCRSSPMGRDETQPTPSADLGHMSDQRLMLDEPESARLIDELREKLVQQIAVTEHLEVASRDRIAEISDELKKERHKRNMIEVARDQLASRLKEAVCGLGCDRCKQAMRMREVPKTAPTRRAAARYRTPCAAVRESKLAYTPVFGGLSRTSTSGAGSPVRGRAVRQRRLVNDDDDDETRTGESD